MPREIQIVTQYYATVKETWTLVVGDDMKVTGDNAGEILDAAAQGQGEAVILTVSYDVFDEGDRTFRDFREIGRATPAAAMILNSATTAEARGC